MLFGKDRFRGTISPTLQVMNWNKRKCSFRSIITVTSAQQPPPDLRPVERVPAEIMFIKSLPTVVTFNQRPNGNLVLSQCLILPLLTVKQATFCKQMKEKIKQFFFIQKMYIFKKSLAYKFTSKVISLQKYLFDSLFQPP